MPRKKPRPVVLVPGIKGTEIANIYPIRHEVTWGIPEGIFEDVYKLALGPSGEADANPKVVQQAGQVFSIVYKEMYDHLQGALEAPVYLFGYDWRLSCKENAHRLQDFVERLAKKPGAPRDGRYHFVCHSMGGLILRGALRLWSDEGGLSSLPVDRIVFIATPHKGSLDAVDAMVRGESMLLKSKRDMRKVARTMPGVYDLLPSYGRAVVRGNTALDIFDIENWQDNVKGKGMDYPVRSRHLRSARRFRTQEMFEIPASMGKRVLQVYGHGSATLRQVPVRKAHEMDNWYRFDDAGKGRGDEVVLSRQSALLPGLPAVRIEKDDLKWYEIQDAMLVRRVSFHAFLPVMNEVRTVVAHFLDGKTETDILPLSLNAGRYHVP